MHINNSSLISKDILNNFKEGKDTGVIQFELFPLLLLWLLLHAITILRHLKSSVLMYLIQYIEPFISCTLQQKQKYDDICCINYSPFCCVFMSFFYESMYYIYFVMWLCAYLFPSVSNVVIIIMFVLLLLFYFFF